MSWQKEIMSVFIKKEQVVSHDLFSSNCKQNLSIGVAKQDLVLLKFQAIILSYHKYYKSLLIWIPALTLPRLKYSNSEICSHRNSVFNQI